ncbi:MAG: ABC transporter ATP-binding protein [Treponema sp.]|nr:ABC transporter ATP-binding protein [Treponema sp.]
MIKTEKLFSGYNGADVIFDIDFNVEKGESFCVLGPNGCGKSTLLKSLARIIDYRGGIFIDDIDISKLPRRKLAKKISLLNQSSLVYFPYTVYDTVSMGRYAHSDSMFGTQCSDDKEIVKEVLIKLDLWENKDRLIDELSGGTLQRVFLARTLAQASDVILLDEPANHLDIKHQIELLEFLRTWTKEKNKILVNVFHDLNLARRFSDSALILIDGKIAAKGDISDVLNSGVLNDAYGIDIKKFMKESYENWILK